MELFNMLCNHWVVVLIILAVAPIVINLISYLFFATIVGAMFVMSMLVSVIIKIFSKLKGRI